MGVGLGDVSINWKLHENQPGGNWSHHIAFCEL